MSPIGGDAMRSMWRFGAVGSLVLGIPGVAGAVQPERAWGTYYGGSGSDSFHDVALDAAGNVYAVGSATSATGIATGGAFDETPNGGDDAILVKFDPGGQRQWGTYLGGAMNDIGRTVAVHGDVVVIGGRTSSSSGIATPGAFQPTKDNTVAGFVAKFSADGALAWATYVSSSGNDIVNSVEVPAAGEIYVCGIIGGASPVADANSHQPGFSGMEDGFLLRLDGAGARVWGTNYGGTGVDSCTRVAHRADGALFFAGITTSTTKIATSGMGGGSMDMFIARFDTAGVRAWGRYFGTSSIENGASLALSPDGGVVALVSTQGTGASTDGTVLAGQYDALVARFDDSGNKVWATYFGGTATEMSGDVAVAPDGAIYFTGNTSSTASIATMGGFQGAIGGTDDSFVAKLTGSGGLVWASYYGGEKGDDPGGVSFFDGALVVAGKSASTMGIASMTAHQTTLAGGFDGVLAKFVPQEQTGTACADAGTCLSGFCVDGVCCDAACGGGAPDDCQACSKDAGASVDGACAAVAMGAECRPASAACDAAEACDGVALACPADAPAEDGTACAGGLCEAGVCVPEGESTSTGETTTSGESSTSSGTTTDGSTSSGTTADGSTSSGTTADGSTSSETTADGSTSSGTTADGSTSSGGTTGDVGATTGSTGGTTSQASASGGASETGSGTDVLTSETAGLTSEASGDEGSTPTSDGTSSGGSSEGSTTDPQGDGSDGCGCASARSPGLFGLFGLAARRRRRVARG
jgi:hypothetical protein